MTVKSSLNDKRTIIDAGNTRIKVAQYQQQSCLSLEVFEEQDIFEKFLISLPQAQACIISNTGAWDFELARNRFQTCLMLNPNTALPFPILYQTPQTLGNDRRALAAAAIRTFPGQATLVIDLGTCITADFVDAEGAYHGGAIGPGLKMRFKALNHFTAGLPLVEWSGLKYPNLVGDSTENSILSGVVRGYAAEISAWIAQYEADFGAIRTVLTGGDANTLRPWLKNDIFAPSKFLLNGLDYILEYHLQSL